METFLQRRSGASVFCERGSTVVSSCPHSNSRSVEVIPGLQGHALIMLQTLLTCQTDTFIFPGLGTKQPECPPSGNDFVSRHHSISG